MARENQGLQITLIVFVFLTIVLAVLTFVFYRQYQQASLDATDARTKQTETDTTNRQLQEEINQLKTAIGNAPSDKADVVSAAIQQDMATYAAQLNDSEKQYRKVLQVMQSTINEKNVNLAALQAENQSLKARNETLEQAKQGQIDQFKKVADDTTQEYLKARFTLENTVKQGDQVRTQLLNTYNKTVADAKNRLATKDTEIAARNTELKATLQNLREKTEAVNQMYKPVFEVADGNIVSVDQRNAMVYINLGTADNLQRQTTFSVYAAGTNDVAETAQKGKIEVTRVIEPHLSQARIVEDELSDPIMPGDQVYTPVWKPGAKQHFALLENMDINGDGKPEPEIVRNLITSMGGVIDAELSDSGVVTGKITGQTRYLVVGQPMDAVNPSDEQQKVASEHAKLEEQAKQLGVETIQLDQLLRRMGWKNQTPVVQYEGGTRSELPAAEVEGAARTGTGNVSDLFKKREPPRGARSTGSAY